MHFDPTTVYLVDQVTTGSGKINYFVRGNEPLLEHGVFAYDELKACLETVIGNGFDLTASKLIDFSVIESTDKQGKHLRHEFSAYGQDFDTLYPEPNWPPVFNNLPVAKQWGEKVAGNAGSVIWYPIEGCTDNANCALVEPSQFDFAGVPVFIRQMLENEEGAVIYLHCIHGKDRTGAAVMAYMMQYHGWTLAEALVNGNPFPEPVEPTYQALVTWYATLI